MNQRENRYMAGNMAASKNVQLNSTNTESSIANINQIEFTWTVEGDQFESFLSAASGVGFESADFAFSGTDWKLKCYPNGTKKYGQGNVSLFLTVMKLPAGVIQL